MALILRWSKSLLLKQCGVCAAVHNRWLSSVPAPTLVCERLQSRGLLQVKGIDASKFLQGLITNDMHHFDGHGAKSPSMYAMILNVQGQVLYDVIIYNLRNGSEKCNTDFLVECDVTGVQELTKLFTMYRIRKKVELTDVSEKFVPWVAFCPPVDDITVNETERSEKVKPNMLDPSRITIMARDPRMQALGWRVVLPTDVAPNEVLKVSQIGKDTSLGYHKLRYKLGVGEGLADLPPGQCYPLESNADYLHGVSFHKGCYVGQELTARTHHTGVIRKRLMPILFSPTVNESIERDTILENEKGRNVGRFVNRQGKFGLGLMRIQECLSAESIQVKKMGVPLTTRRPEWWPVEQPKESLAAREQLKRSKALMKGYEPAA